MAKSSARALLTILTVLGLVLAQNVAARAVTERSDTDQIDPGTEIPIDLFVDMATDRTHEVAYLAGGGANGKVVVVDGAGTIERTFSDLPYLQSITLSTDASTLYGFLQGPGSIVAIDLASGARRTYATGNAGDCDSDLTFVGADLWFSTCDDGDGNGYPTDVGVLDPADGSVHRALGTHGSTYGLVADPSVPHALFVNTEVGVTRYQTTTDASGAPSLTPVAVSRRARGMLTVSPDGRRLIVGGLVLRSSDLAAVDRYSSPGGTTAFAESASGVVAVGAQSDDGPAAVLFRPGSTVFAESVDYTPTGAPHPVLVQPRGMAFSGSTLFTVTGGYRFENPVPFSVHVSRPEPPADPIGSGVIDLPALAQVVSDPGHDQAFVSTDSSGNGVVVLDGQGRIKHVVQHLPGISAMARSGDTLWLSLEATDTIAAVDTRTYSVRSYLLDKNSEPLGVAAAVGKVWYSSEHACPDRGGLDALDPTTGRIDRCVAGQRMIQMRATRLHPHSIYGLAPDLDFPNPYFGTPETRLEVHGGSHPSAEVMARQNVESDSTDAVQTFDRLDLLYASPNDTRHHALDPVHLAYAGVGGERGPTSAAESVAARPDGLVAIGYATNERYGVDVRVGAFGPVIQRFTPPPGTGHLVPSGLAFAQRSLYVLTANTTATGTAYRAVVVPMPARQAVALSADQEAYRIGTGLTLVAHVDQALLGQHPVVSVTEHPNGHAARTLASRVTPDSYGNVTLRSTLVAPVAFYATVRYGSHTFSTRLVRQPRP